MVENMNSEVRLDEKCGLYEGDRLKIISLRLDFLFFKMEIIRFLPS